MDGRRRAWLGLISNAGAAGAHVVYVVGVRGKSGARSRGKAKERRYVMELVAGDREDIGVVRVTSWLRRARRSIGLC